MSFVFLQETWERRMRVIFTFIFNNDIAVLFILLSDPTGTKLPGRPRVEATFTYLK